MSELEGTEESIVKEMMKSSAKEYKGFTYEDAYADDDLLAATLEASSRTSGQPHPNSPSQTVDQAPPIVQEVRVCEERSDELRRRMYWDGVDVFLTS